MTSRAERLEQQRARKRSVRHHATLAITLLVAWALIASVTVATMLILALARP